MERHKLLTIITALSFPAHVLALWLPIGTPGAMFFAAVAGLLNMAVLPPVVVMAQELVPAGAAVSSGIVMGAAWAAGSIGVLGTGLIGDAVGARTAALISFPLMLSATALALHPALRRHPTPAG
jgi:predicted MFS family arabinose efflux permease